MEKKIRIQLFSEKGELESDRLVAQGPEMYNGPKEVHKGPMRIEFTFMEKGDVEEVKEYLDKLVGILPLEVKQKIKKSKSEILTVDNHEEFLKSALESGENQDMFIQHLRENGFVFVMTDFIEMLDLPIEFKKLHKEKYQWMIRLLRRAKNPKNDKYDPMLIFGIQMLERNEKIVIYKDGKYVDKVNIPLPGKPRETFKKTEMIKFPPYMTPDEREKFRIELRKYLDDKKKPFSKFFKRWMEWVENLPDLKREETNEE